MYNLSKLRVLSNDLYDRIWIWHQMFKAKKVARDASFKSVVKIAPHYT